MNEPTRTLTRPNLLIAIALSSGLHILALIFWWGMPLRAGGDSAVIQANLLPAQKKTSPLENKAPSAKLQRSIAPKTIRQATKASPRESPYRPPTFLWPPDFSEAESIALHNAAELRIRIRISVNAEPTIDIIESKNIPPDFLSSILITLSTSKYLPAYRDGLPVSGSFDIFIFGQPEDSALTKNIKSPNHQRPNTNRAQEQ